MIAAVCCFGIYMYFIVVIGALLLNLLAGRLFSPYCGWIVSSHVSMANKFSDRKFKTVRLWGAVISVLMFVIVWTAVELAFLFLQVQSEVYAYIIYGLSVFGFIQCGQLIGRMKKLYGNLENAVYLKQIFASLLVKDGASLNNQSYKKAFTATVSRIFAERIITTSILLLILGPGAAAGYIFLNTFANSDHSEKLISHGFFDVAIRINGIISFPGYAVLSLIMWCIKWVTGRKFEKKTCRIRTRPAAQLFEFSESKSLDDSMISAVIKVIYFGTILLGLMLTAGYIFVESVFAALGLDEYWNFWNGKNIDKTT